MHLFISPHSDDVPLSCGGTVHHLVEAEEAEVVIITMMSGDPPDPLPDSPFIRELHQRWKTGENTAAVRRDEDRAAAERLNAKAIVFTSEPDCIYRVSAGDAHPLYPSEDAIFGEIHPEDSVPAALKDVTLPYFNDVEAIYAPLGVGHHIDHQILSAWAMDLAGKHRDLPVWFYTDYPYAQDSHAVERALSQFPVQLRAEIKPVFESDVRAKIEAIACYKTQISTFWSSVDEMEARIRAYMNITGQGVPAERFWRLNGA